MKTILLTSAFLLVTCLTSKAQIIAGQYGPDDVFEKSNYYMTIGGYVTEDFPIDIDFDGQNDFQFRIFSSHWYGHPYGGCFINSLGEWKIAIDTFLCNPGSTNMICSIPFSEGSLIHNYSKWAQTAVYSIKTTIIRSHLNNATFILSIRSLMLVLTKKQAMTRYTDG